MLNVTWAGHAKPLCGLLAKLVQCRDVYITLFKGDSILTKVHEELNAYFVTEEEDLRRNLIKYVCLASFHHFSLMGLIHEYRVIGLPWSRNTSDAESYRTIFQTKYKELWNGCPITTGISSRELYESIPRPQLAIVDVRPLLQITSYQKANWYVQYFCYEEMKIIRSISGSEVPVYAFQHASASAALHFFGPESMGGLGDLASKIDEVKSRVVDMDAVKAEVDLVSEVLCMCMDYIPLIRYFPVPIQIFRRNYDENLGTIPGLPPMHNYEHSPQSVSLWYYEQFIFCINLLIVQAGRGGRASDVPFFVQYSHRQISNFHKSFIIILINGSQIDS